MERGSCGTIEKSPSLMLGLTRVEKQLEELEVSLYNIWGVLGLSPPPAAEGQKEATMESAVRQLSSELLMARGQVLEALRLKIMNCGHLAGEIFEAVKDI